jgi:nitrate reductase alpha subunit
MKAASSLFAPGRLSKSENIVSDCQGIAAAIASAASHVLNRSFFISKENRFFTHLADFFESFAVLMRAA